jgi:hypothetical protein
MARPLGSLEVGSSERIRFPPPLKIPFHIAKGSFTFQKASGGGVRVVTPPSVKVRVQVPEGSDVRAEPQIEGKNVTIHVWANKDPSKSKLVWKELEVPVHAYGRLSVSLVSGGTTLQKPKCHDSPDRSMIP